MVTKLEHWLGDDEKVGARLRSIRDGSGRFILHKHYRASDAPDAVLLAAALFAGLDDEDVAATYPSLVAAVCDATSKRAPAEPAEVEVPIAGV